MGGAARAEVGEEWDGMVEREVNKMHNERQTMQDVKQSAVHQDLTPVSGQHQACPGVWQHKGR